jgi:alpha-beta hydrolase superfamily lysophospholipase
VVKPESQASRPRPAADLDGWDASWSRFVDAPDHRGVTRCWHLLDTGATSATRLTVLAVHGNPTWSYTWRHLATAVPDDVRVIAPDQLEMGFSERSGELRRLGDRIADLVALTDVLGLSGDVVVVAHDWGGPVSLGWLQHVHANRDSLDIVGLVLTNTAVHQPPESSAPTLIRNARRPLWLGQVTVETSAFLRGMFELSNPRTPAEIRRGYLAPYDTPDRRKAIGEFVADIPLEADHPSAAVLDAVAAGLADLGDVPTLLVWGAGDRVFSDIYLYDLEARLPHADVHRHPKAGHLVSEDTDVASIVVDWLEALDTDETSRPPSAPVDLSAALRDRAIADRVAVREMGADGRTVTFGELDDCGAAHRRGPLRHWRCAGRRPGGPDDPTGRRSRHRPVCLLADGRSARADRWWARPGPDERSDEGGRPRPPDRDSAGACGSEDTSLAGAPHRRRADQSCGPPPARRGA